MIERGKISSSQLAKMMYLSILSTYILVAPAFISQYAGRDMWISPLWASLVGMLTVAIAYALHTRHPGQTVIQYSVTLLGPFLGKLVGFLYLFYYLFLSGVIVREYGEFVIGAFFTRTPIVVVMGSILLISAFAARGGVEVVGRLAELFVPVFVAVVALFIVLILPELDPKNMLPILEHGFAPSLKGAFVPQGWMSELFLLAFLLPFLTDRQNGMKSGLIVVVFVTATLTIANLATLWLFGDITSRLTFPTYRAVQYIDVAQFLQNIDALVMALWVSSVFVKIAVFHYVLVLGTAQWLGLSDYRPLALPLALLVLIMAVWSAPGFSQLLRFIGTALPVYKTVMQILLPLVLLLVSALRRRRSPLPGVESVDRSAGTASTTTGPAGAT